MEKWMTNAKDISFDMHDLGVTWYAKQWNGKNPIISGQDDGVFIIDMAGHTIYTLSFGVAVMSHIRFIQDHEDNTRSFMRSYDDKSHTKKLVDLDLEEWSHLMLLVIDCPRSRRWLMREQLKHNH